MIYVLVVLGCLTVIGAIVFFVEAKKAPIIDDGEPFLHDDYDPKKDPTYKFNIDTTKIDCSEPEATINVEAVKIS